MEIALFTADAPLGDALHTLLEAQAPGTSRRFSLPMAGPGDALGMDRMIQQGTSLAGVRRAWIQGHAHQNPVVPDPAEGVDWGLWQVDYLARQQRESARMSLLQEMERRGVRMFNGFAAYQAGFHLYASLERLRGAGLAIPPLLCANDPQEARAFLDAHSRVVWHPASGRGAWQLFRPKQLKALLETDPAPTPLLLAPAREGTLCHAYLVGGTLQLLLGQDAPSNQPGEERLEQFWRLPIPERLRLPLERAAALLHADWLLIRLVDGPGGPWIYDFDPDPVLNDLPPPFRDALLRLLAHALLGGEGPLPALPPQGEPHQRPALFVRRMLCLLFDLEASKGRDDG
ncbi:MAG: hypothetical protein HQL51_12780 [Magnetococcales bacterium]|nr:hypothetical protein [Magnetococcales bacterium]